MDKDAADSHRHGNRDTSPWVSRVLNGAGTRSRGARSEGALARSKSESEELR